NLVDILGGKFNDLSDRIIVDAIDDCYHQGNFNAYLRQVLNGTDLYIKQVSDAPVLVLFLANAVKLQINAVLSCSLCRFTKLKVFSKANSVGRCQNAIEPDLFRIGNCVEVIRRKSRLATRKQDNYLPARLK